TAAYPTRRKQISSRPAFAETPAVPNRGLFFLCRQKRTICKVVSLGRVPFVEGWQVFFQKSVGTVPIRNWTSLLRPFPPQPCKFCQGFDRCSFSSDARISFSKRKINSRFLWK